MAGLKPDTRGYCKVKAGAHYAGVSVRTFRDWLKGGLTHFRLSSGTILIGYRDIDAWLESFRVGGCEVEQIADRIMDDL